MKLSDWLVDMQTKGKVLVNAKQLREYTKLVYDYQFQLEEQQGIISDLRKEIDRLETKLSLNELVKPVTIDLFA